MGLALHNPSDSLFLSDLIEHRYLPGRPGTEYSNPRAKHPRRPLDWSRDKLGMITGDFCDLPYEDEPLLRPHHQAVIDAHAAIHRRLQYRHRSWDDLTHARLNNHARKRWAAEEDEGRALAWSEVPLPGDKDRGHRPPSLERQDAFRDERSVKKRSFQHMSDVVDVDDLYRLGLLYDDEHERGSGFTLDAIVHDEPLFNLHVRPTKRGRSARASRGRSPSQATWGSEGEMVDFYLPLEYSFAAFGDDESLAAFLISPDDGELVPEDIAEPTIHDPPIPSKDGDTPQLTVIYELESEDADYSQDDDDTTQTQHSLDDAAAVEPVVATAGDFSDLVSDVSYSSRRNSCTCTEVGEDDDFNWAFLDGNGNDGAAAATQTAIAKEEEEQGDGDNHSTADTDADAWIVLGNDGL
jgi:hypothetical protein